jgi:hypothetical protein
MILRCPACGKTFRLPSADAGLPVVCVACGERFIAPEFCESPGRGDAAASGGIAGQADGGLRPFSAVLVWVLGITGAIGLAIAAAITGKAISDARHPIQANVRVEQAQPGRKLNLPTNPSAKPFAIHPATTQFAKTSFSTAKPASRPSTRPAIAAAPMPQQAAPKILPSDFFRFWQPTTQATTAPAVAVSLPKRPPLAPVQPPTTGLTDAKIGDSIKRGVDYLLQQFDPRTGLLLDAESNADGHAIGADVLCVYALLQCGQAIDDPRLNPKGPLIKGMINAMKSLPLSTYHWETYARGLRATALAVYDRPEDRQILGSDAAALVRAGGRGAYTYSLHPPTRSGFFQWDNSNSQYGVLGVWSAAETGHEIPNGYWEAVRKHWQETQCSNGQWDYYGGPGRSFGRGTHSMTCAGLASLFVAQDWLDPVRFDGNVGREPFTPSIVAGLKWLESGDNAIALDHGPYDLYGLERVGLASGFKYFGTHDWYRELAAATIDLQQADGRWEGGGQGLREVMPARFLVSNGPLVDTAYSLLFLARGRHPILMNKLRFPGYWANRPRDLSNLARFASRQLERPLNWQVVSLEKDWTDWTDSPILYLASHQGVHLQQKDYDGIRNFVENGGLLFTQADGNSPAFNQFAAELARKLFPDYESQDLPDNHPLYSTMFKLQPIAGLKYVTNGSRMLMLHSTTDLSRYWQIRDDRNKPVPFQFGLNLFVYAAGKQDLSNRLESTYIPKVPAAPTATFPIARLSYAGNWDPEPAAWERFSRYFQLHTGSGLQMKTMPLRDLRPGAVPFAVLTGSARYDFAPDEAKAVKSYVEAGGVLLIDTTGGTGPFAQSVQSTLLDKAFPDRPLRLVAPAHPLLTRTPTGTEDLSKPRLRLYAIDVLGARGGFPEELESGRGHVLFTALDLTTALLGTQTWGILGYEPSYAQSLVNNAILWTWDGQKDQ